MFHLSRLDRIVFVALLNALTMIFAALAAVTSPGEHSDAVPLDGGSHQLPLAVGHGNLRRRRQRDKDRLSWTVRSVLAALMIALSVLVSATPATAATAHPGNGQAAASYRSLLGVDTRGMAGRKP
jgi:Spy/CpxP family protein refolding chaperone